MDKQIIGPESIGLQRSSEQTESKKTDVFIDSELIDGFLVSNVSLLIKDLAQELDGLKLLQLSDFHFGPVTPVSYLKRAMRIAAPLSPDILLLTGDYLQLSTVGIRHVLSPIKIRAGKYRKSSHRKQVRNCTQGLCDLISVIKAPLGTFAVLGNHDYSEGAKIIVSQLGEQITWLKNSSCKIEIGSAALHIAGVDDCRYGRPDLKQVKNGLEVDSQIHPGPQILLSHNPDIVLNPDFTKLKGIDLLVCGHTHGGQIRLPFIGPISTQTHQKQHTRGLSHRGQTAIYVSSGIGFGGISLRVNCPPELVIFELNKA